MKDLLKSKSIILFIIFMIVVACIASEQNKNASANDTDKQTNVNNIYTSSVSQK